MEPGEALATAAQIAVALALFACLFSMLLLTITPTPLCIWRWCSGFSLVLIFTFSFLSWQRQSEVGPTLFKGMGAYRYLFYTIAILGTAVGLLQAYNALVSGVFSFFYAAIVF